MQRVFDADGVIPAHQLQTRVIRVVVGVMMGEQQPAEIGRPEARAGQLPRAGGAAVHHDQVVLEFDETRCPETLGSGGGCTCTEDMKCGHERITPRAAQNSGNPEGSMAEMYAWRAKRSVIPAM